MTTTVVPPKKKTLREIIEGQTTASQLPREIDVLAQEHSFMDSKDNYIRGQKLGTPNLDWAIGKDANNELVWDRWDVESPHLLVTGKSGSGKSYIMDNLLYQLLSNNHKLDLDIWLADAKNHLHRFKNYPQVKRYIVQEYKQRGPTRPEQFTSLVQDAVTEMLRRYRIMAKNPEKPQNIAEARALARHSPTLFAHLNFPYIVIVIEESSAFLSEMPQAYGPLNGSTRFLCKIPWLRKKISSQSIRKSKMQHEQMRENLTRLAREARAAGIHMVLTTQYATKENMPLVLKSQCRHINLAEKSVFGSMLSMGEQGLEKIEISGRGFYSPAWPSEQGRVEFRGFDMSAPPLAGI